MNEFKYTYDREIIDEEGNKKYVVVLTNLRYDKKEVTFDNKEDMVNYIQMHL